MLISVFPLTANMLLKKQKNKTKKYKYSGQISIASIELLFSVVISKHAVSECNTQGKKLK